jgi:hypothetical protein
MTDHKLGLVLLEKLPTLDLKWSEEMQLQWWRWFKIIVCLIKPSAKP